MLQESLPFFGINVLFAGLTAAGKTTHAKLLAKDLGYTYVSATELLVELAGVHKEPGESVWSDADKYAYIQSLRASDDLDDELERQLLAMIRSRTHTVFDTWAMAWLADVPTLRIWIDSDRLSRTLKCLVSDRSRNIGLQDAIAIIDKKDSDTREIFLRRHGFDLFTDFGEFELVLSNTFLISEPTLEATLSGIAQFAPDVLRGVHHCMGGQSIEPSSTVRDRADTFLRVRRCTGATS